MSAAQPGRRTESRAQRASQQLGARQRSALRRLAKLRVPDRRPAVPTLGRLLDAYAQLQQLIHDVKAGVAEHPGLKTILSAWVEGYETSYDPVRGIERLDASGYRTYTREQPMVSKVVF